MVKFITAIAIAFAGLSAAAPLAQPGSATTIHEDKRTNAYINYGSAEDYEAVNKDKRTNSYINYGSAEDYEAVNKDKRTNSYINYGSAEDYEAVNTEKN